MKLLQPLKCRKSAKMAAFVISWVSSGFLTKVVKLIFVHHLGLSLQPCELEW